MRGSFALLLVLIGGCISVERAPDVRGHVCGEGTVVRGNECVGVAPPAAPRVVCGAGTLLRGNECVVATQVRVPQVPTDADIRHMIIEESLRGYTGECPCPYNVSSDGSRCGDRSVYSHPGGFEPFCYAEDVPDEMVARYRQRI